MKFLFTYTISTLAIVTAFHFPLTAHAKTDGPTALECGADQSLWVYEFGDRGSTQAPEADGGNHNEAFQVWEWDGQHFWIGELTGLPNQITAAKTLEKILLEEGEEEEVPLGTFSSTSPLNKQELNRVGSISPKSEIGAMSFNLEPSVTTLFDSQSYNNALTYVANADAQIEYVRLSLCSNEVVSNNTGIENSDDKDPDAKIAELQSENQALQELLNSQSTQIKEQKGILDLELEKNANQTDTINDLNSLLKDAPQVIDDLKAKVAKLEPQIKKFSDDNTQLINENGRLNAANHIWKIASGFLAFLSLGLGGLLLLRPNGRFSDKSSARITNPNSPETERPLKPIERSDDGGVVFAGSPLFAANVATPLSPAGQLTASNLQMLKGPFQVLRPAYHATGRIGYAQEGKPTSEDYSFGTGFLITPNHVMTNRHVHGFYGHYLTTDENCGGIEFIAEKDKDASDFIPFNGKPPLLLDGLDIAIYTLSRSAGNRTPINRVPIPTEELDGRDIAVIGYPDAYDLTDADVLAVVEDNPILAVKRISQGKIFRHSTDDEDPYGVEVKIIENDEKDFPMEAICHNASTLGGNSGSPILDLKTGELLGVHFAGHKIFNEKEAANLAMAISQLTEHSDIENV